MKTILKTIGSYGNAGKPNPPMVELRDIPNGGKCYSASGKLRTKTGWLKDSSTSGAVKVFCHEDGTNDYMCASAHVLPLESVPAGWQYEDELPDVYPYEEMFPRSQVILGVRMFPPLPVKEPHEVHG